MPNTHFRVSYKVFIFLFIYIFGLFFFFFVPFYFEDSGEVTGKSWGRERGAGSAKDLEGVAVSAVGYRRRQSLTSFFYFYSWRNEGGNSLYGHSGKARPRIHGLVQEQERAPQHASSDSYARDLPGKNVSKEVCFWLKGKDNFVQLPKEPRITWTMDAVCFSGQQGVSHLCLLTNFYKQGPVRRWICISFDTERWSGLSYKRSRSWFRTADGKWNGIKCLFCWWSVLVSI